MTNGDGVSFYAETGGRTVLPGYCRVGPPFPLHWTPPLASYQKRTSSGVLVSDILTVHGDFIAVHPVASLPLRSERLVLPLLRIVEGVVGASAVYAARSCGGHPTGAWRRSAATW